MNCTNVVSAAILNDSTSFPEASFWESSAMNGRIGPPI